jgi:hypothetical protein
MKREPHKAIKKDPDSIQPAPRPGPGYDPMDRIVQDLQNIQSFIAHLDEHPDDLNYLESHLSRILGMRRTITHQLDRLSDEPYGYGASKLELLKKENERIFSYVEGAAGAMMRPDLEELKKFIAACGKTLSKFDGNLTP